MISILKERWTVPELIAHWNEWILKTNPKNFGLIRCLTEKDLSQAFAKKRISLDKALSLANIHKTNQIPIETVKSQYYNCSDDLYFVVIQNNNTDEAEFSIAFFKVLHKHDFQQLINVIDLNYMIKNHNNYKLLQKILAEHNQQLPLDYHLLSEYSVSGVYGFFQSALLKHELSKHQLSCFVKGNNVFVLTPILFHYGLHERCNDDIFDNELRYAHGLTKCETLYVLVIDKNSLSDGSFSDIMKSKSTLYHFNVNFNQQKIDFTHQPKDYDCGNKIMIDMLFEFAKQYEQNNQSLPITTKHEVLNNLDELFSCIFNFKSEFQKG